MSDIVISLLVATLVATICNFLLLVYCALNIDDWFDTLRVIVKMIKAKKLTGEDLIVDE